jgi:hypothetical protein
MQFQRECGRKERRCLQRVWCTMGVVKGVINSAGLGGCGQRELIGAGGTAILKVGARANEDDTRRPALRLLTSEIGTPISEQSPLVPDRAQRASATLRRVVRRAVRDSQADVKQARRTAFVGRVRGRGEMLLWSLQSPGFLFSMATSRSFVVDIIVVVAIAMSHLVWRGPAQGCCFVATMLSLPLS